MKPLVTTSLAVFRLPNLMTFLDAPLVYRFFHQNFPNCGGVVAWGRKPSASAAEALAKRHKLKLLRLEDGFLRSVGLGSDDPPLSIVVDDLGIYYAASAPSRLETLIASPFLEAEQSRARDLVARWRTARVSKYNHLREGTALLGRYVLVVDQTWGDASIRYGLADENSFHRMLTAALVENPDCRVVLKVHPEVMAGRKNGHFDLKALAENPRVHVLGEDAHPVPLIEHAEAVYVVTSQMGFEGLLWGKRVRTFGMPFYAGWGLTEDELPAPARRRSAPLESLVHAALVDYPRYVDPETGERCSPERVIEWMGLQRRMRERFPSTVYATGFSIYKRSIVRSFFRGSSLRFSRSIKKVPDGAMLAVWGRKPDVPDTLSVLRLEDGFLRSVGLGADLIRPVSWVMDRRGIYFDATRPSDLEHLLQTCVFDDSLVNHAAALRERLVRAGLTKYNVGDGGWLRPEERTDSLDAALLPPSGGTQPTEHTKRRVILVPGQVESDASLAYGAPGIRRNLDLLRAVREANLDAYVVYKPHPDVVAGLRRQGRGEDAAEQWCDEVVTDVGMGVLLPKVDEVHTLTSLTGFEALLRGKKVTCYGQPFYAGWGLTTDMVPPERRTRKLTLDELVAGTLILYPTYVSRTTGRFTTPERALDELLEWRERGATTVSQWRKAFRWVLRMTKG